jgi:hypothetical protein
MALEHWLIVGLAGVCLLLLFVGRPFRRSASAADRKPSGPTPDDKYLPIWVVLCMSIAVLVLSHQMTSAIKDVCNSPGKCNSGSSSEGELSNQTMDGRTKSADASAGADASHKVPDASSATSEPATSPAPTGTQSKK